MAEICLPRVLPRMIMKGAKCKEVKAVQQALISYGYGIKADGTFGQRTQAALRTFQLHKGLFPSGVIDQDTVNFIFADLQPPEDTRNRRDPKKLLPPAIYDPNLADISRHETVTMVQTQCFPWIVSHSPHHLHLSEDGFRFIYRNETLKDKSEYTHWPKGESGVTIGPGYDMRGRKPAEIVRDLTAIGVEPAIAQKLSNGTGLKHVPAETFADAHKSLLTLTPHQQMQLLKLISPHYEAIVKRHITIDLFQFEYDALVSFVYNPGGSFVPIAQNINAGYIANAMTAIRHRIGSVKSLQPGLLRRRNDEIALYMYGKYGRLPDVT